MARARPPGVPQVDSVYRDPAMGASSEIARLTRAHQRELDRVAPIASAVYVARIGRIGAGVALLTGTAVIIAALIARAVDGAVLFDGFATAVLIATWPAALVVRSVARAIARRRFAVVSARALAMAGDAYPDVVRMRALDVSAAARALAQRLEGPSVGVVLAGVAMLAPLTLHLSLAAPRGISLAEFDHWIELSAVLVGHCHLVLAAIAWCYGRVLRSGNDAAAARAGWQAWRLTVATSFFPGVFLIGIPVFIVGLTGLFVPAMFAAVRALVLAERSRLDAIAA